MQKATMNSLCLVCSCSVPRSCKLQDTELTPKNNVTSRASNMKITIGHDATAIMGIMAVAPGTRTMPLPRDCFEARTLLRQILFCCLVLCELFSCFFLLMCHFNVLSLELQSILKMNLTT